MLWIASIALIFSFIYLVYAIINPERF
ncbi:MAG: K(+)-transporting ATPase subunit F [Candidatus Dadabacteria bacterium]|nr:K(+)-transporting ATPase subunit F [Candidatus Dadabacteria bacterium]